MSPAKPGNSRPIDIVKKSIAVVGDGSPGSLHSLDSCGSWNILSGSRLSLHSLEGAASGGTPAHTSELCAQPDKSDGGKGETDGAATTNTTDRAERARLPHASRRVNVGHPFSGGDGGHAADSAEGGGHTAADGVDDVFDETSALLIDDDGDFEDDDDDGGDDHASPHPDGRSTSGYATSDGDDGADEEGTRERGDNEGESEESFFTFPSGTDVEAADDDDSSEPTVASSAPRTGRTGASCEDMTCTCAECVALAGGTATTGAATAGATRASADSSSSSTPGQTRAERLLALRSLFLPMYRRCAPECDEGATGWGGRWMVEMSKLLPGGAH